MADTTASGAASRAYTPDSTNSASTTPAVDPRAVENIALAADLLGRELANIGTLTDAHRDLVDEDDSGMLDIAYSRLIDLDVAGALDALAGAVTVASCAPDAPEDGTRRAQRHEENARVRRHLWIVSKTVRALVLAAAPAPVEPDEPAYGLDHDHAANALDDVLTLLESIKRLSHRSGPIPRLVDIAAGIVTDVMTMIETAGDEVRA